MKRGKRCFHQSCLAAAPFASPSNPEVHACEIHKKRDFVNMRNKRCLAPGCYRNPHYGVSRLIDPNSKAQYCTKHKSPGMQNVNGGRCAGPDCSKQPRFSMPGEKGKYCSKHREEGMVDVLYTPCAADGCKKHPHFGHVEGGPRYCAQHRSEGMVDVKHRRCAVKSCRKDRVLIPGTAMKRGKFCEVHCDVNELINKEAGSSNGASNDKKSSRTWTPGTEDDGEYMSSEGSQLGSSIGEQKSNMSCDGSSANSSIRPSIHDAAQGLAYLAMLASRECAPLYSGSTYDHGSTPFQPPEHAENFRRGPARAAAGRGPSSAGFNEGRTAPHAAMINEYHAETASARPSFYPVGKRRSETDPQYPMFKRERIHSDDSFGARRLRVSPELRGSGSGNGNSDRTVSPASTPAPPFDLRYSSEYSAYPCPWEFAREGQGARWAEGNVRAPTPVRGWNSHHSAV